MSKRVSQLYGLDIYTEKGDYVGKVEDVILNLENGEVMRLSLLPFRASALPPEDVRRIITEESIGYDDVIRVGDIIISRKNPKKEGKKAKKTAPAREA
jgi:sporulation protein YlmC with PRC-barrel domain